MPIGRERGHAACTSTPVMPFIYWRGPPRQRVLVDHGHAFDDVPVDWHGLAGVDDEDEDVEQHFLAVGARAGDQVFLTLRGAKPFAQGASPTQIAPS
jgi:hypothetical protein